MRLRRWRVARLRRNDKTGYESPHTRFWTRRGAGNAALRFNMLHAEEYRGGLTQALRGTQVGPLWHPIRDRELVGLRANHALIASGSFDRHPAGRQLPTPTRTSASRPPSFQSYVPRTGDPVQPDGDVTMLTPEVKERIRERTARRIQAVDWPTLEPLDPLGGDAAADERDDVSRRPVHPEAERDA